MQSLQDIHDKIFFETKIILETLAKIQSKDELLAKQDLFTELTDRIAFLRILEKNEDSFNEIIASKIKNNPVSDENTFIDETFGQLELNENDISENFIEEEVMFTNELNDFEDEIETEEQTYRDSLTSENWDEPNEIEVEPNTKSNLIADESPLTSNQKIPGTDEVADQQEQDLEQLNERRTIAEFTPPENLLADFSSIETETPQQDADKKFKLAHIKGLKLMQQLFDNDPLQQEKLSDEEKPELGSTVKPNIKNDFMEAGKKKPEFKLDLNDKVAFSKSLFGGNDGELKSTIEKLNSFATLEEAKQYLSEIYHGKDWSKKDEFAQRLWSLVESKF